MSSMRPHDRMSALLLAAAVPVYAVLTLLTWRHTSDLAARTGAVPAGLASLAPAPFDAALAILGALLCVRLATAVERRFETRATVVLAVAVAAIQAADVLGRSDRAIGVAMAVALPVIGVLIAHAALRELARREQARALTRAAEVSARERELEQAEREHAVERERLELAERAARERAEAERRERRERRQARERAAERAALAAVPLRALPSAHPTEHQVAHPPEADRSAVIAALAAEHGDRLSGAVVASALGVGESTARRYLAAWRADTANTGEDVRAG